MPTPNKGTPPPKKKTQEELWAEMQAKRYDKSKQGARVDAPNPPAKKDASGSWMDKVMRALQGG